MSTHDTTSAPLAPADDCHHTLKDCHGERGPCIRCGKIVEPIEKRRQRGTDVNTLHIDGEPLIMGYRCFDIRLLISSTEFLDVQFHGRDVFEARKRCEREITQYGVYEWRGSVAFMGGLRPLEEVAP